MIALGFGKYVRSDKVFALERLVGDQRGEGRRTRVWIEGVPEPIVASRTEVTILRDMGEEAAADIPVLDEALDLAARLAAAADAGRVDPATWGAARVASSPRPPSRSCRPRTEPLQKVERAFRRQRARGTSAGVTFGANGHATDESGRPPGRPWPRPPRSAEVPELRWLSDARGALSAPERFFTRRASENRQSRSSELPQPVRVLLVPERQDHLRRSDRAVKKRESTPRRARSCSSHR